MDNFIFVKTELHGACVDNPMKKIKALLFSLLALGFTTVAKAGSYWDVTASSVTAKIPMIIKSSSTAGPLQVSTSTTGSPNALAVTAAGNIISSGTLNVAGGIAANLAMNSHKITGLTAGSVSGDAVNYDQLSAISAGSFSYGKADLVYIATGTVDIATNTGTANQTCVSFPDTTSRCVTENTASASKYRRLILTETAEYTSGTENSGIRTGYTALNDTFYWVYAVKSVIDVTKYVLEATTTPAIVSNYATLNGFYGANGWSYQGKIRYGDNSNIDNDIVPFIMHGDFMLYTNECATGSAGSTASGLLLANTAGASSLDYTFATGITGKVIPIDVTQMYVSQNVNPGSTGTMNYYHSTAAGGGNTYHQRLYGVTSTVATTFLPAGFNFGADGPASSNYNFYLYGYIDGALGVGNEYTH